VKLEQRFAEVDVKLEQRFAEVDVKLEQLEKRLLRWMFVFWVGSLGTVITLLRLFP
jgi:hypothetical protein